MDERGHGRDAREQTLRTIVDTLLSRRADYRDLFTTRRTFLTPLLGSLYRVPIAQNEGPWQPYEFPPGDPRIGIQSHASFVALHSHEGLSSPTLRGKALREILLCEPIPAPPGNVNFAVAQDTHNPNFRTMRERLTAHRTDPTCSGCHKLMDPIGLALEGFDSDASYRTTENGVPIDTSGELDGVQFRDAAGLAQAIHDNPATGPCFLRRLYSYATGRPVTRRDMPWIRELEKSFAADDYRVPELLRRIAASPHLYRVTAPPVTVAASELLRWRDLQMNPVSFNRRRLLRGMLGGTAVTVGLPFLEIFLDDSGTAEAASGTPLPVCFGTWFYGCGLNPGRWEPRAAGRGYDFGVELHPLTAGKNQLNVYSRMSALLDGRTAGGAHGRDCRSHAGYRPAHPGAPDESGAELRHGDCRHRGITHALSLAGGRLHRQSAQQSQQAQRRCPQPRGDLTGGALPTHLWPGLSRSQRCQLHS